MGLALATLVLCGLSIGAFAAIFLGDLGAVSAAPREQLLLVAMASALAAAQTFLAYRSSVTGGGSVLVVRDGSVVSAPNAVPGQKTSLLVHSGQAAVIERLGTFARVLPPGLAALKSGETVFKIVSTLPRTLAGSVECTTCDGIPVTIDFQVAARISATPSDRQDTGIAPLRAGRQVVHAPPALAQPWSAAAVVRAAYETHSWESALLAETRAVLRELVIQTNLDSYLAPPLGPGGSRRGADALQDRALARIATAARVWGLGVEAVRVLHVHMPAQVTAALVRTRGSAPTHDTMAARTADALAASAAGGPPPPGLTIAPVLGREGISTLRLALRQPCALVTARTAGVDGRPMAIDSAVSESPLQTLRSDRSYFALRVQGGAFRDLRLFDGDYAVLEDSTEPANGDLVAASWEGRVALWRYWKQADHALLSPETTTRSPIAVVTTGRIAEVVRRRYAAQQPPVTILRENEVRLLGRMVAALREPRPGLAKDTRAPSPPQGREGVSQR